MVGPTTPLVVLKLVPRFVVYFTESAKYASSAVTRFRRSDFIDARYAFSFVLANFGIAMAARMPMITTTINSSISVKPLRFIAPFPCGVRCDFPTHFSATVMPEAARTPQAQRRQRLACEGRAVSSPESPRRPCRLQQVSQCDICLSRYDRLHPLQLRV